jgi:hypothetical protein
MIRDLTHELATSDKFGKFCNWFQMPLLKGEELTDVCINRGYLKPARSSLWRSEFRERSEIFIMTAALYRLGTGSSFWTCRVVSNISVSEIRSFFDTFLHAMHEMREDYISMLTTRWQACRAVADRWMWCMSNGHHVQLVIIIAPRVRGVSQSCVLVCYRFQSPDFSRIV